MEFIQDMKEGEKALIFTGRKVTYVDKKSDFIMIRTFIASLSLYFSADDLSSDLTLQGLLVQCIHGDR